MIRNFIFDWSGTLVDDLPPVIEATNAVLTHYGQPAMNRDTFVREFSLPFVHFYERVLPGVPFVELDKIFCEAFESSRLPATILPHAKEFLEFCRERGCRLFVLSSALEKQLREQGRTAGIHDYFERIYAGVKDKREVIGGILASNNLRAEETAFVGDMEHDVATARSAGIIAVAVLTGYDSREELSAAQPDLMASDLEVLRRMMTEFRFDPHPTRPIATVGALIYNAGGEVLMIRTHKWSNKWGIPGGKIERGETCEQALVREVCEETGLEIGSICFRMLQDCVEPEEFYAPAHFLLLNYTAKHSSGEVHLNEEAEAFVWMEPKAALVDLELNAPTRRLLMHVTNTEDSSR